jgi:hypothetical protein
MSLKWGSEKNLADERASGGTVTVVAFAAPQVGPTLDAFFVD